ncbi:trimethylamine transporter [Hydra vulgaris]|uniref:Trimethylamine transporter n=1 Tax=Hydra vulgaris TaxID=6087 RepID=A0ABM4D7H2_HYDVU
MEHHNTQKAFLADRKQKKVCHVTNTCAKTIFKKDSELNNDRCLNVKGKFGPFQFYFNPLTTCLSAVIIWAFVVWCIYNPIESYNEISKWKIWITHKWTWLYIGTRDVWALFIIVIYFSKYSSLKLGKDNEKPEFSDASYFTMLFSAGIGVGLFYFGVAEPVYHYAPGRDRNRYWGRYNDNQRAQDAINLSFFHWGIHGWIVYVLIGLLLGVLSHRRGLPMTMRSCFYPLLGDKVFGLFGDFVDTMSIICTMLGVCTSLGLGVIQLNSGLSRLHESIEESVSNQIIIIWCVTIVTTASVISGVKFGIKWLSEICFMVGTVLLLVVFFSDDTWFLLNLFVQSCGYYVQNFIEVGFHTDAFEMKGDAPDGKQAPGWMDAWTLFYWGWWVSWSPFVGMFFAKISRGRTIKEFITYTLTVPIFYTFLWLTVFGGAGLAMERKAEVLNISCEMYNTSLFPTYGPKYIKETFGVHRLSCRLSTDMWFDVIEQYGEIGSALHVLSIVGLILYFITSSDSGSLVIDCLSANGNPDPPILQRVFWSFTEGATATALLKAGGKNALIALQTASVCAGLPYTFILNFACVSLWRILKIEAGDLDEEAGKWHVGLFDCFTTKLRFKNTLLTTIAPWYLLAETATKVEAKKKAYFAAYSIFYAFLFYGWITLMVCETIVDGISYAGWVILVIFFGYACRVRGSVREKYKLQGNIVEDFFSLCLLYPCAILQIHEQVDYELETNLFTGLQQCNTQKQISVNQNAQSDV